MKSEEVLAILAIAFAVVQFLDARDQEHELGAISGDLKTETTNLKQQIIGITTQANQLHEELQAITNNLGSEIKGITNQANQLHSQLQSITQDLGRQSEVLRGELTGISRNLTQQADGLKDISGSISTRFVGPFPENMQEIIALLKNAKRKIEIVVDFPGYGQYSALRSHVKYTEALIGARQESVTIQIICYQLGLVRKERLEQFPDITPEQWTRKCADKKFTDYFALFKSIPMPKDCAGLREAFTRRDSALIKELGDRGVDWKFHSEPAAIFLWMIDDAEAIFTFKNVGRKDVGLSFRTHDGNLVRQFGEIFARRWNNAKDEYDPPAMQS